MAIPTAEMNIITGAQSDLATIKTKLDSLISRANSMYDLKTGNAQALSYCLQTRGKARELLGLVEQAHADLGRALIAVYGADGEAVVNGGGGGRR